VAGKEDNCDPFAAASSAKKRRTADGVPDDFIELAATELAPVNPTNKFVIGAYQAPPWSPQGIAVPNTPDTLHDEIQAFCRITCPTAEERVQREAAVERLRSFVKGRWGGACVNIYGSHVTGLSLFTSDVDTVVMGMGEARPIFALGDALHRQPCVLDLQVISTAKVPIVKYIDAESHIAIDISFDEASGVENSRIMGDFARLFPAMPPLVIVLKYMLKQRKLDEVYTGGK